MSDNMSETSWVQENSKWDPPEDELEPDSQVSKWLSRSPSSSFLIGSPLKMSARLSRSTKLEVSTGAAMTGVSVCRMAAA